MPHLDGPKVSTEAIMEELADPVKTLCSSEKTRLIRIFLNQSQLHASFQEKSDMSSVPSSEDLASWYWHLGGCFARYTP